MLAIRKTTNLIVMSLLVLAVGMFASNHVSAIARGYTSSDEGLAAGMVAVLSASGGSEVERADQTNLKRIVGIVTTSETSTLTLASSESKVLVESEGEVNAYISDINGTVKKGDALTLSSFKGIMMKSVGSGGTVLAVAAEDSYETGVESTEYNYIENGSNKTTKITKIKVNLNKQALSASQESDPTTLAKIGESLTGKQVSDIRVFAALIIFILVLIAEGGIIYGAVTSAITALGRNPMARKMIRREMIRVIIIAVGVLFIGLGAVYGVLWY